MATNTGDSMQPLRWTVTALIASLAVTACTTPQQQAASKDDLLVASGFRFVPANTPERQAMFRSLPPHKFLREVRGDRVIYVYPDPIACACLYIGNAQAYTNYRQAVFQKSLADEEALTANDISFTTMNWNWQPWAVGYGPGWFYY
jgi:hypothetical protein